MRVRLLALVLLGALALAPSAAAAPVPPTVVGAPVYGGTLAVAATDPSYAYQWLRSGSVIPGAVAPSYTAVLEDIGHPLAVQVTAPDGVATSAPTAAVAPATMTASRQRVLGVARYTHSLRVRAGRFSAPSSSVAFAWPDGSVGRSYAIRPEDVGHRVRVEITATAPGFAPLTVVASSSRVQHRIGVRRVVRYHVETRGHLTASVKEFRTLAQATYDDARGWRSAGIEFRPVAHGGAFTLVLSTAGLVPSFSSSCSAMWSCRVGRYVIINQDRWLHASPAWNAAGLPLRDYRHMVVNHETGHWLGLGHAPCPGPGQLAPVMMQQSKGLGGCRFNPFPTQREIASRTPQARAVGFGRVVVE